MAKTIKEERLRWVLPVARKEVRLIDVVKVCPYGKRSLERWLATYRRHGEAGLEEVIRRAPFVISSIKTDNHATFTNYYTGTKKRSDLLARSLHVLDARCRELGIKHYLIDPGKPAQNGTVERSHREDQEKLYDQVAFTSAEDLRYRVRLWNMYYNDLEHCGLNGKTPNEFLRDYQLINPPNVPA